MSNSEIVLYPESIALTLLAAAFSRFILEEDRDRWHWRVYFFTIVFVNVFFGVFGPWGYLFGVLGVAVAPFFYFVVFRERQYTLRDMLLYVLLFASMCTQIASGVNR